MSTELSAAWRMYCKSPEEKEFMALYAASAPLVFTICLRMTGRNEDAEDAFQSTYVRLVRERNEEPGCNAKILISRTARREADALRARRNRRAAKEIAVEEFVNLNKDVLDDREKGLLKLALERLIQTLPDELRIPVLLHYFDGLTHQEIADVLEVSRPTITVRLKRALEELEPRLKAEGIQSSFTAFSMIAAGAALLSPSPGLSAQGVWSTVISAQASASAVAASTAATTSVGVKALVVAAIVACLVIMGTVTAVQLNSATGQSAGAGVVQANAGTPPVSHAAEVEPAVRLVSKNSQRDTVFDDTSEANPQMPANAVTTTATAAEAVIAENEIVHGETAPWRIVGIVTDESGTPLPNIMIRHGNIGTKANHDNSTQTDVEGRYSLWLPKGESHRVAAYGKGYAASWKERITPGTREEPQHIDFKLEQGVTIAGTVQDEQGQVVVGARLFTRAVDDQNLLGFPGQEWERFTTNAQGQFSIPDVTAKELNLVVRKEGYTSFIENAIPSETVKVILPDAEVIAGEVVDAETGNPVREFTIALRYEKNQVEVSDAAGLFVLDRLDGTKTYSLAIESPQYETLRIENLEPMRLEDSSIHTFKLTKGQQLRIELIDVQQNTPIVGGKALSGLWRENYMIDWAQLKEDFTPPYAGWSCMVCDITYGVTDTEGNVTFSEGEVPRLIAIWTPGYERVLIRPEERKQWQVAPGHLAVPLRRAGNLEVLTILNGEPQTEVDLEIISAAFDGGREVYQKRKTNNDGIAIWDTLAPGDYKVMAMRSESGFYNSWFQRTITINSGENHQLNLFNELGTATIKGQVTEVEGVLPEITSVRLNPKDRSDIEFKATVDGLGKFSFSQLREGAYELSANDGKVVNGRVRETRKNIQVVDGLQLDISLSPKEVIRTASIKIVLPDLPDLGGWKDVEISVMPVAVPKNSNAYHFGVNPTWSKVIDGSVTVVLQKALGDTYYLSIQGSITDDQEGEKPAFMIFLDHEFNIEPNKETQDWGTLTLPNLFAVDVTITGNEENFPKSVTLFAGDENRTPALAGYSQVTIENSVKSTVRFLPEGEYKMSLIVSPGLEATPTGIPVILESGNQPMLNFQLNKNLIALFSVVESSTQLPVNSLSQIQLSGADWERMLTKEHETIDQAYFSASSHDTFYSEYGLIRFGNLPEGEELSIRVKAEGYEDGLLTFSVDMIDPQIPFVIPLKRQ
ncbi:MAG: sigma-70 family RNA polymerase sigma factor [Sumerlaeia bacterium]